jgi:hypothetical protein
MSDTKDQLTASVEGAIKDAEMLEALAIAGTVEMMDKGPERKRARKDYELDNDADVTEALDTIALEVYANARLSPDGARDIQEIVVVTGTGGPHVEFSVSWNDGTVVATGWWGSDKVERYAYEAAPALAEYLADWFEYR